MMRATRYLGALLLSLTLLQPSSAAAGDEEAVTQVAVETDGTDVTEPMVKARPALKPPTDPRECLILALYHEARSESEDSLLKHAWTIVWRVKRDDFPNSVCAVVFDRGAFSAFNNGVRSVTDARTLQRVTGIADLVLAKAFPSSYGGNECAEWDQYTGACIYTVADTISMPIDVVTHYAVADCKYLSKPGYNYVETEDGECVPYWAVKMKRVDEEPCALVDDRPCRVVFWRSG